ncbi:uncharacterized protein [Miscanthus floridulus]|uniref:uncharacterized protein n=1 Tax=Miscanthus floridulus TaxID=154761 RepID=UPI003458BD9D
MEAAMAMIHSQPHLSLPSYSDLEDDDGFSSSGELLRGGGGTNSSGGRSSSLRRRSYGDDVAILSTGGAPLPRSSKPSPRHVNGRGGTTDEHAVDANFHVWTTDEHAAEAYFHVSVAPGYVSFEDVIGGAALYRDRSGQPLEAAISDPLMRTASRLYVREDGRSHHCRQQSPGPLGTRRGSAMHAIIKKAGRYEVDGYVYSAAEEPKIMITGKWNKSLTACSFRLKRSWIITADWFGVREKYCSSL